jgi:hypothetical protein
VTLRELRRECAHKRAEYQIARQVRSTVALLAVRDLTALETELRDALLAYYSAHGALHEKLRAGGSREHKRLH